MCKIVCACSLSRGHGATIPLLNANCLMQRLLEVCIVWVALKHSQHCFGGRTHRNSATRSARARRANHTHARTHARTRTRAHTHTHTHTHMHNYTHAPHAQTHTNHTHAQVHIAAVTHCRERPTRASSVQQGQEPQRLSPHAPHSPLQQERLPSGPCTPQRPLCSPSSAFISLSQSRVKRSK